MNPGNKNIWDYIVIAWVLFWISSIVVLVYIYGIVTVAGASLLLVPFILCGFIIPLIIFYNRSKLDFPHLKNWITTLIPRKSQKRPKNIHYFCLTIIPLTCIFILYLIFNPDSFLHYGPKYNANYSYSLAMTHFFYLISYIGYWKLKKWGFYLFLSALALRVCIQNLWLDIPFSIHSFTYDIFVIILGFIYILKSVQINRSTT